MKLRNPTLFTQYGCKRLKVGVGVNIIIQILIDCMGMS